MTTHQHLFNELSSFYISMWSYLNSFFDDTRWLNPYPNGTSQADYFNDLRNQLQKLGQFRDSAYLEQVQKDFGEVESLRETFPQSAFETWRGAYRKMAPQSSQVPLVSDWFSRADQLRQYAQQLSLRYVQLASEKTASK